VSEPPQINATLLAISRPGTGFTEDYDRPADPLTPAWQGQSGAYVRQKMQSRFNPMGGSDRTTDITVYIDSDIARAVSLKAGDTLTVQYLDNTYAVRAMEVATTVLPGTGDSCRVALEEMGEDQLAT
jgi:hypothetical protein